MEREIIKVPRVPNFRGLGGIKVGEETFKNGLVYRSASFAKVNKSGIKALEKLGIKCIIDLRNEKEWVEKPDPKMEGVENIGFDFTGGSLPGITREKLEGMDAKTFLSAPPSMEALYDFVLDPDHIETVGQALKKVIDCVLEGKPVLMHCSAGKDRTGILTMLLLKLLGADEEEIFKDYLITNDWAIPSAKRLTFLARLRDKEMAKNIYPLYVADEAYLRAGIDAVIKYYGSFDNLFFEVFKISKKDVSDLKEACLS